MPLIVVIELLFALGFALHGVGSAADGIGHLIDALSDAGWFQAAPEMSPQLSLGNEALYTQFQQLMDTQFQIGELRRLTLTMPALSNEGF
jgi:hypothetical protein